MRRERREKKGTKPGTLKDRVVWVRSIYLQEFYI